MLLLAYKYTLLLIISLTTYVRIYTSATCYVGLWKACAGGASRLLSRMRNGDAEKIHGDQQSGHASRLYRMPKIEVIEPKIAYRRGSDAGK